MISVNWMINTDSYGCGEWAAISLSSLNDLLQNQSGLLVPIVTIETEAEQTRAGCAAKAARAAFEV
jgi:hypothetical protein